MWQRKENKPALVYDWQAHVCKFGASFTFALLFVLRERARTSASERGELCAKSAGVRLRGGHCAA